MFGFAIIGNQLFTDHDLTLYLFSEKARFLLQAGKIESAAEDILGIRDNLSIQNDIKRFFQEELKALSGSSGAGSPVQHEQIRRLKPLRALPQKSHFEGAEPNFIPLPSREGEKSHNLGVC